jgi:hypothetical protein
VFENGVMRKVFGVKRDKYQETGDNFVMRNFMICTFHQLTGRNISNNEICLEV